jgi:hypothetical protein
MCGFKPTSSTNAVATVSDRSSSAWQRRGPFRTPRHRHPTRHSVLRSPHAGPAAGSACRRSDHPVERAHLRLHLLQRLLLVVAVVSFHHLPSRRHHRLRRRTRTDRPTHRHYLRLRRRACRHDYLHRRRHHPTPPRTPHPNHLQPDCPPPGVPRRLAVLQSDVNRFRLHRSRVGFFLHRLVSIHVDCPPRWTATPIPCRCPTRRRHDRSHSHRPAGRRGGCEAPPRAA